MYDGNNLCLGWPYVLCMQWLYETYKVNPTQCTHQTLCYMLCLPANTSYHLGISMLDKHVKSTTILLVLLAINIKCKKSRHCREVILADYFTQCTYWTCEQNLLQSVACLAQA